MKRKHWILTIFALACLAYFYIPKLHLAEKFAPRIQTELEQALGRKVKFDKVSFNIIPGLGFAVDEVVIYDDPANDMEPVAYVGSLEMRISLLSLLSGKMGFTGLRLVEPSVNLKHSADRGWNVQQLLNQALLSAGKSHPGLAIQVRTGRVNFKSGDRKSVFYITDADVDIESSSRSTGGFDIVFSGAPARTDRAAQGFGRLTGRGEFRPGPQGEGEVELTLNLQKSSVGEIAVLAAGRDLGIHGLIASEAKLNGPLSNITITGHADLSDIHRWDLMGSKSEGWPVDYKGVLDFRSQVLNLQTVPGKAAPEPVALRVSVRNYLTTPRWAALITMKELSANPLLAVARHMGAGIPEKLSMDGKVEGVLGFSNASGFQGQLRMSEATAKVPDQEAMQIPAAQIKISGSRAELLTTRFELAENRHVDLDAAMSFDSQQVELKVATPGLGVRDVEVFTRLLNIEAAPVLKSCERGNWRGVLRFDGEWKGDLEIMGAVIALPDLSDKLEIGRAAVQIRGDRLAISKLKAKAGTLSFDGDFQWLPHAARPAHVHLHAQAASAAQLDHLLSPVLHRQQGFFARTLRLDRAPVPEWLTGRHVEGTIGVDSFVIGGHTLEHLNLTLTWDAIHAGFHPVHFSEQDVHAAGSITADLAYALPIFSVSGTLEGPSITLGQDLDAQSISGKFVIKGQRGAPSLQASNLELISGKETYTGKGGSIQDGRLQFDLLCGKKSLRLGGTLSPLALELQPLQKPN